MVNWRAKQVLWDSIPTGCGKQLLFRIAQQNASIFITFYSIRQFELTAVAMVNNCATFVILILGWLMLGERASMFSFVTLTVSFVGTVLVLVGEKAVMDASSDLPVVGTAESLLATAPLSAGYIFGLLFLISNPVIIGVGVIAMRQMRKMHEAVITTYMNLMLLVIMFSIVFATGSDLTPWYSFGVVEWLAIAGLAFANVGSQTFKFRAVQRSHVGKLQPLTFTQTILQFAADLFLFNESFTMLQFIGIGLVFAMFMVMVGNVAIYGVP